MKRILTCLFVLVILLATPVVSLAETDTGNKIPDEISEQVDLDGLYSKVPKGTKDLLNSLGLDEIDYNNIIDVSPKQLFKTLASILSGTYASPLKGALSVIVIIVLASLIKGFSTSFNESTIAPVLSSSASIFVALVLVVGVSSCISNACSIIKMSSDFTLLFVPIFTFLVAASGSPLSAVGFSSLIFGLGQTLTKLSSIFVMPIANIFLGIGITAGIKPELNLSSITAFLKKYTVMILSFVSTMFMTIVSIKTNITSGVDALGDKSLRFALSSFVPVIGSAISDGLTSIKGYLSLMKSAVGIFSIIVIVLIYIPGVLEIIVWNLALGVCSVCCDLFGEKSVGTIVKAVQDTLSILLVVLLLCMVVTIISIGIMISIKAGG